MDRKTLRVKDFTLSDEGHVRVAFAGVGEVDREKDYTFPGAIPDKDIIISAYSHASWPQKGGLLPTGRGHISEQDGVAVMEGDFFLKTTQGRDTYETVKALEGLQEWSYGYDVLETADPPVGVKAARGLKKLDIFEVSPVLIGAGLVGGQPTFTMDIKSLSPDVKDAASNVADASYALGAILRLIIDESDTEDGEDDAAEDAADVTYLRTASDALTAYIAATAQEVGSPEDMADIAAEAAARAAAMINYGWDDLSILASLKSGSLAGLPYAEMSSRLLRDIEAFSSRTKGILDLRVKEGRAISKARLEQLTSHSSALADAKKLIDEMIASAQPKDDSEGKARAMRMKSALASVAVDYAIND